MIERFLDLRASSDFSARAADLYVAFDNQDLRAGCFSVHVELRSELLEQDIVTDDSKGTIRMGANIEERLPGE